MFLQFVTASLQISSGHSCLADEYWGDVFSMHLSGDLWIWIISDHCLKMVIWQHFPREKLSCPTVTNYLKIKILYSTKYWNLYPHRFVALILYLEDYKSVTTTSYFAFQNVSDLASSFPCLQVTCHHSLNISFLGSIRCSWLTLYSPSTVLEQVISVRSSGSFWWRKVYRS